MRRARAWAWKRVARVAAWVVRWASVRAAKACACAACRLLYDPRMQARAVEAMFAREMGGTVPARRDRRPS
jgi:hypothetical protein